MAETEGERPEPRTSYHQAAFAEGSDWTCAACQERVAETEEPNKALCPRCYERHLQMRTASRVLGFHFGA